MSVQGLAVEQPGFQCGHAMPITAYGAAQWLQAGEYLLVEGCRNPVYSKSPAGRAPSGVWYRRQAAACRNT